MGARAVAPSDASSSAAKSVEPPLKIAIEKPAPMEIKDPVVKRRVCVPHKNNFEFGILEAFFATNSNVGYVCKSRLFDSTRRTCASLACFRAT